MIVYIFIFLILLLFRFVFQKKFFFPKNSNCSIVAQRKKVDAFLLASFLLLLFFTAFRGEKVGIDVPEYLRWFQKFNSLGWKRTFEIEKDIELGYLCINYIISRFTLDPHYLIITVSFFILFLHITFLKKSSRDFFLSLMLFLSFNHFFTSMCSWRQFIAMGIVFFAYPLFFEKKYICAIFVMGFAFLFHFTTILFDVSVLIAYVFSRKKKWLVLFLLFCIFFPPFFEKLFFSVIEIIPKYSIYANSKYQTLGTVGKLRYAYIIIEFFIIFYVIVTKNMRNRSINFMCIMLCFSIFIGLLGAKIPLIFRLGYYFDYFLVLIIPDLICIRGKKNKASLKLAVVFWGFLFYLYYMLTNSAGMIPWYMYNR